MFGRKFRLTLVGLTYRNFNFPSKNHDFVLLGVKISRFLQKSMERGQNLLAAIWLSPSSSGQFLVLHYWHYWQEYFDPIYIFIYNWPFLYFSDTLYFILPNALPFRSLRHFPFLWRADKRRITRYWYDESPYRRSRIESYLFKKKHHEKKTLEGIWILGLHQDATLDAISQIIIIIYKNIYFRFFHDIFIILLKPNSKMLMMEDVESHENANN